MELVETFTKKSKMFFPQREFLLMDGDQKVCNLMVMEIAENELDLTVSTVPKYRRQGYAVIGLRMLIMWAARNGYKKVQLTNLFGSDAIEKIAKKLNFIKGAGTNIWNKSIIGPLNL